MAYADRNASGSRVVALVIVGLLHVALGYAFVTGLAYQYVKKVSEKLNTFDVEPPPPPPPDEPPPPPPPDQPMTPPPVVSPPPIVRTPSPPVIMNTVPTPPKVYVPTPIAVPPAPPAPPAPRVDQSAKIRGNAGRFFGPDNYPSQAKRENAEGTTRVRLTVGTDGKVTNCAVTSSSGNDSLDDTTCRIFRSRVRFTPAKDQSGNPISDSLTQSVTWKLTG
ncbi:outer membrane transport energization protein TonB [Hephaestia caeni]|uniref:Outer membrane transport energization protein TonB n=1 Tax=Hephaestia caeni TaxID=645617 RepID=A0A397P5S6_9SPHN|nr:energy transducer TonB [Hephaestia caeni]RIA43603.1 outer membrane transport energization protein TonB [Hephaestia caeni]